MIWEFSKICHIVTNFSILSLLLNKKQGYCVQGVYNLADANVQLNKKDNCTELEHMRCKKAVRQ